jgi:hypothetical protein
LQVKTYNRADPKLEIAAIAIKCPLIEEFPCKIRGTSDKNSKIAYAKHQIHKRTASPNLIAVLLFLLIEKCDQRSYNFHAE